MIQLDMKNVLKIMAAALLPSAVMADTIPVEQARYLGPVEVRLPFATENVNAQGAAYDVKDLLNANKQLVYRVGSSDQMIQRGSALAVDTINDNTVLSALQFTLSVSKFTKGQLSFKNLGNHKIFIDGKEMQGRDLRLKPGQTEVALLCLSQAASKDSFIVDLTGDDLSGIQVNPTGKRLYSLQDMISGEFYSGVSLSPSGKYQVTYSYTKKEDGSGDYRTVITDTERQRVVYRLAHYQSLTWMPNRDVLYFTRNTDRGMQLVTLDPATLQETVMAENLPEGSFIMSPTEDYLIYPKTQEGKRPANALKRIQEPDDRMPGWRNTAYLMRYDLRKGVMTQLTFGKSSLYLNDISKDGKRLLVACSKMDTRRRPFSRTSLLTIQVEDGKVDTLLKDTAHIAEAKFSPDGHQLMIKAAPDAFDGIGAELKPGQVANAFDYRLYLYDIASRKVTPMLKNFNAAVGSFQWSAADNQVYFKATDECNETLYRLDVKNARVTRFNLPVSYIQQYAVALGQKQPRAVFFGQTGERSREMFTCFLNKETPKCERIGQINFDEMYKDVAIGTCHDWSFRTSRGDTVKGFYFLPPNFDETKQYPMLVYYYGGCTPTAKLLEFHYPLQVFASMGYVVYVCEPSGAIGFGQEFAARHVNTWGKESADDIIEGTKAFVKAHPFVNAKKIGCMGASYGGFMTQYLQTRTDIFAAAISHAGISNIASYWGGGYWGYTYGEVAQYGSFPWNNPELYTQQSPLFNAHKIKTPLLLLHGTADTNVPTNESQQMFTALRILGKPVSYIVIDGEDHVITHHQKRLLWQEAIFAWFAHWLKDEPQWWNDLYPEDRFGQTEEGK